MYVLGGWPDGAHVSMGVVSFVPWYASLVYPMPVRAGRVRSFQSHDSATDDMRRVSSGLTQVSKESCGSKVEGARREAKESMREKY